MLMMWGGLILPCSHLTTRLEGVTITDKTLFKHLNTTLFFKMGEKEKKILLQWKMQEERFVSGNAEQSYSGFKIKKNTNRALQSILIVVKHESGSRQIAVTHQL